MAGNQPALMIQAANADELVKMFQAEGLNSLAIRIADRTVRHDVEAYAKPVEHDGLTFYDTNTAQDGSGDPTEALAYVHMALDYIGRRGDALPWYMQRHIDASQLVRFVEKESNDG